MQHEAQHRSPILGSGKITVKGPGRRLQPGVIQEATAAYSARNTVAG
jgi:hypothetical protein